MASTDDGSRVICDVVRFKLESDDEVNTQLYAQAVDWFFKNSASSQPIHISRGSSVKHKKYFKKFDIIKFSYADLFVYNLKIKRVSFQDAGIYACQISDLEGMGRKGGATLTVVSVSNCSSLLIGTFFRQECQLQETGFTSLTTVWSCPFKKFQQNNIVEYVKKFDSTLSTKRWSTILRASLEADSYNLTTCKLMITSENFSKLKIPDLSDESPLFNMTVIFSANETATKHVHPSCDFGTLPTLTKFIFHSENTRANGFSPKQSITPYYCTFSKDTFENIFHKAFSCEDFASAKCINMFQNEMNGFAGFINVDKTKFKTMCDQFPEAHKCLKEIIKVCPSRKKLSATFNSYKYFCSSDYTKLHTKPLNKSIFKKCYTLYPQQIVYFNKTASQNRQDKRDINVLEQSFCNRIEEATKIFCIEHLLTAVGNSELSKWFLAYIEQQQKLFNLFPIHAVISGQLSSLSSCNDLKEIDGEYVKVVCPTVRMCFPFLLRLLHSINFGFTIIENINEFDSIVCSNNLEEIKLCFGYFILSCNPVIQNVIKPLLSFWKQICYDLKMSYKQHSVL
ncbi:hypothetical protein HELRODRAFT_179649 [Helobdella robusta]|uniref:Ig-like domain-containing protein n=1 Tax=Helobdella robusta TaxID=6412 RepID=T1FEZ6_HELRO|nr:hypothetical protein HELRODRAFT_179649 [Helobdella robusta]ESN95301.1 hypothetical protein HELRODRAFT_179649 [Helobdella robusta]